MNNTQNISGCCHKCHHCNVFGDSDRYNWNHLLFVIDIMVQQKKLNESQMKKIIDVIDIKKLVTHNKLTPKFIENVLRPIVENDFNSSDSDDLTMNDIYRIQNYNK